MPQTLGSSVAVILVGLCGAGSWPALRQRVGHVDYRVFGPSIAVILCFLTPESVGVVVALLRWAGGVNKHARVLLAPRPAQWLLYCDRVPAVGRRLKKRCVRVFVHRSAPLPARHVSLRRAAPRGALARRGDRAMAWHIRIWSLPNSEASTVVAARRAHGSTSCPIWCCANRTRRSTWVYLMMTIKMMCRVRSVASCRLSRAPHGEVGSSFTTKRNRRAGTTTTQREQLGRGTVT